MTGNDFDEDSWISDWAEANCRHLDVVASWETLCDVYATLKFEDPLTDMERLEEFKWIIAEVNKFLTRQRNTLRSCKTFEAAVEKLKDAMVPQGRVFLDTRKQIVYHKLRIRWLTMAISQMRSQMIEEVPDGWN